MKKSFFALVIFMLISAGFISEITAQPGRYQWRKNKIHEKLELTDEQEKQLDQLRNKHQNTMIDLRASLQKARLEVKNITESGNVDRAKYIAAVESVGKIQDKIRTAQANHKMDIYNLLTDKQKKILEDYPGWFLYGGRGGRGNNDGQFYGRRWNGRGLGDCRF